MSSTGIPLSLNPLDVPLSRYGSYLGVSCNWPHRRPQEKALEWFVRWIRDDANTLIFRIELLEHGQKVNPASASGEVGRLILHAPGGGTAEFTVPADDELAVRCSGAGVRFETMAGEYCYGNELAPGFWEVLPSAAQPKFGFVGTSVQGRAEWRYDGKAASCSAVQVDVLPGADGAPAEALVRVYEDAWSDRPAQRPFDESVRSLQDEFRAWRAPFGQVSGDHADALDLATYVLWLNTVGAHGLYPSPVILGSKNWMKVVWSWDHCFTALGVARAHPQLAWEQFKLMIPMQGPSGMLCDVLRTERRMWTCTKSPVHGWTLAHLRRLIPGLTRDDVAEVYEPMVRWTRFWLTHRNLDGDGLPCLLYPNESFDATTHTAVQAPCKAPDHAAYLVLQCEAVAQLARDLGHAGDAAAFDAAGQRVLEAMLRHLWDGRRFVGRRIRDGYTPPGDCIFNYMPILLGRRLPDDVLRPMVQRLRDPRTFLGDFGLTTEAMDSSLFDPDAYVRGRIWTPPNWLIPEGLDAIGEHDLARTIRQRYLRTLQRGGMSECFDPRDGRPLEDPAYNWTAASYVALASL
jgi:putative isomerase